MAEVASKNKRKKSYFELGLKEKGTPWWKSATIEFVEYNNEVVGYQVSINGGIISQYPHLFNIITKERHYNWNDALWVPEDYMEMPRPFAKKGKDIV